jgi:hypothetical protein
MMWTNLHIHRNLIGQSCLIAYFCIKLKRNIDYGKTGYCHKRKNPFRIP